MKYLPNFYDENIYKAGTIWYIVKSEVLNFAREAAEQ